MQVVDNGVVAKALNALFHGKVLVDDDFEAAAHLFVVYLVALPGQLLLLKIDNVNDLCTGIDFCNLLDFLLDYVHLFHHEGLLPLAPFHVINPLLLDAILDLLLCRLVDFIKDLQLRSL